MDRMEDSGSFDLGSNPGGVTTNKPNNLIVRLLYFNGERFRERILKIFDLFNKKIPNFFGWGFALNNETDL